MQETLGCLLWQLDKKDKRVRVRRREQCAPDIVGRCARAQRPGDKMKPDRSEKLKESQHG